MHAWRWRAKDVGGACAPCWSVFSDAASPSVSRKSTELSSSALRATGVAAHSPRVSLSTVVPTLKRASVELISAFSMNDLPLWRGPVALTTWNGVAKHAEFSALRAASGTKSSPLASIARSCTGGVREQSVDASSALERAAETRRIAAEASILNFGWEASKKIAIEIQKLSGSGSPCP